VVNLSDYNAWRSAFGTSTIIFGSGADGNYNGVIDAADYLVWRNSLSDAGLGASLAEAGVPEPAAGAPFVLAAVWLYFRRISRQRYASLT
jgi:hypothetical protein